VEPGKVPAERREVVAVRARARSTVLGAKHGKVGQGSEPVEVPRFAPDRSVRGGHIEEGLVHVLQVKVPPVAFLAGKGGRQCAGSGAHGLGVRTLGARARGEPLRLNLGVDLVRGRNRRLCDRHSATGAGDGGVIYGGKAKVVNGWS
jgi:hypothetical protein